jgi:hypothetical protein
MCDTVRIKCVKCSTEHGKQLGLSGKKCGLLNFPTAPGALTGVRRN